MKLDLVLPSFKRKRKLLNCINSIEKAKKAHDIGVYVYFSDYEELQEFRKGNHRPWVFLHMVNNYRVPSFWNSHLKHMEADAMVYLNDDILFYDDTLDTLFASFLQAFPDYDGVLGINQANLKDVNKLESAYGVIGKKYAERFPNKSVWCPDYHRFYGDKELGEYAKKIGKFVYAPSVRIIHLHPAFDHTQLDETHVAVREWLPQDKETYYLRKEKGYLWGQNYQLLNR